MQSRTRLVLGVVSLALVPGVTVVIAGPGEPGPENQTDPSYEPDPICTLALDEQCMRYKLPLFGNPSFDADLRQKYIDAFGDEHCYMSYVNTFDCFYKKWEDACDDAVHIAAVAGAYPYEPGYVCQPIAATGDYTLQVGPDVANKITINYQHAPRQTALVQLIAENYVSPRPVEVSGPYRNLPDPADVEPGALFNCVAVNSNGNFMSQKDRILEVNRNANRGELHSDLAGYQFPCVISGASQTCIEPVHLAEPTASNVFDPGLKAQVHHVVPRKDKRSCPWGTNSYKNAAVISARLNQYFSNKNPPSSEVLQLNNAPAYPP